MTKRPCAWRPIGAGCPLLSAFLVAFTGAFAALPCHAAPEEIQVYLDDMKAPGKAGVDVHNNYVMSGRRSPEYDGEQPPRHVYRLTPEFNYGLTDTLEFGLYVLSTHPSSGSVHFDGGKVRIKYIAPHNAEAGVFWGANLEVGRTSRRVSETAWNAELKGILGYRSGPWLLAVNPNLDWSLSHGGGPVVADVDVKLAYSVDDKTQLGVESYNELGPLSHLQALSRNSKTLYAVLDHDFGLFDLNAGIGHGVTNEADRWLLKFIVGVQF